VTAKEKLRRAHALLHRAVDWVCWCDEEPGRESEALRRVRWIAVRLLLLAWRA
jgi:hypothetical protein